MTDRGHMPEPSLPAGVALHAYEDLLAEADEDFAWPELDENSAAALVLHLGHDRAPQGRALQPPLRHPPHLRDQPARRARACGRPIARCRSSPCSTSTPGASLMPRPWSAPALVFAGARTDGASLHELITSERVTYAAAVPTVWLGLVQHLRARPADVSMGSSGSASVAPPARSGCSRRWATGTACASTRAGA